MLSTSARSTSVLSAAADDLASAPQDGDREAALRAVAEQALLGLAAAQAEAAKLPLVELGTLAGEPFAHPVGEGQVHVVAAEQDVIADRDALQGEPAALLADRDQAEVGGAAADVADQHQVADSHRRRRQASPLASIQA